MQRKTLGIWLLLTGLCGLSAPAALGQVAAVSTYPASYFRDAQLSTAYDMVNRLPGFVFDDGKSARGFAGTEGNVLIDGVRPTAKTDDLQAILTRIPASRVERIDLIRGGAPGIDMQGRSVVADVILKAENSTAVIATLGNIAYADRTDAPSGSIEYSHRAGARSYDFTVSRIGEVYDDSAGDGYYVFSGPGGASQSGRVMRRGIQRLGWGANGATVQPLLAGDFGANFTLQDLYFTSRLTYGAPASETFFRKEEIRQGELGLNWTGTVGASDIALLGLARLERDDEIDTGSAPGSAQFFGLVRDTSESIVRGTWRYHWTDRLTLESGLEGAYNTLNGRSRFVDNGAVVGLPAGDARVNERRGEAQVQATWKFAATGSLEGGVRVEISHISALGVAARDFSFLKPRLLASWSPWDNVQLRLRAERVVGQLDFSNFVASANLSGVGLSAGNLDLRPDRRWQFEAAAEYHFWDKGALVVSGMHEDIGDLVDFIPIGGGLDGPGNIAKAQNEEFHVTLAIPLDRLGPKAGMLKANLKWDDSALKDPVTGQTRSISNQKDRNISFEYTQDVAAWNSSFDLAFNPGAWSNPSYRIDQVEKTRLVTPYVQASWEYKPEPGLDLVVEADNFIPYHLQIQQDNYAGPRSTAALLEVQDIRSAAEPRLYLRLRKSF